MSNAANKVLLPALVLHALASALHFSHNAQFLGAYPNLPPWVTPTSIYGVWWAIFFVGALGYLLYRAGYIVTGLSLLTIYTGAGLDGLLHYSRAPMHAHTAMMNFSILAEAATAAVALAITLCIAVAHVRHAGTGTRRHRGES